MTGNYPRRPLSPAPSVTTRSRTFRPLTATARAFLWTLPGDVTLAYGSADAGVLSPVRAVDDATGEGLAPLVPERVRRLARDDVKRLEASGLDNELARRLVRLAWCGHASWIAQLAAQTGASERSAAAAYFAAGFGSGALDLALVAERQDWPDRWDFVAVGPILRGLFDATTDLARRVLERGDSVLDHPQLRSFLPQVEEALRQRVPVSALIPVVGLATVQAMRRAGAGALSIDAGKTLMFEREAMLASADEAGITIVGRERS
jgi:hypothetical protein